MRALVINLACETERMAFMADQLDRLGIPFERLNAATPQTVTPPVGDPFWSRWQRPLRQTECAAFASHHAAWARVAADDEPVLILEDDALLLPEVPAILEQVADLPDVEHLTLETRGRRKLIAQTRHPKAPIHRLWQDRTGAAAYVLRPSGAAKLLARSKVAPALADAMVCAAYDLLSWQAVPALACQLDRCEAEGIVPPIETESGINAEEKPGSGYSIGQRLRRIAGQLRMGVRFETHRFSSTYRCVALGAQSATGHSNPTRSVDGSVAGKGVAG